MVKRVLKYAIVVVLAILFAQLISYCFLDDIIVHFTSNSIVYIGVRIFLVVVFLILFLKLLSGEKFNLSFGKISIISFIIIYVILLLVLTIFKAETLNREYNLIPFLFLFDFTNVNFIIGLLNIGANTLIFVPLGFLLYIWKKNIFFAAQFCLYTSLLIEVVQFITRRGYFDIDDIILNTVGGLLGIFICRLYIK
ncbi:VanZ family protein [Halalkalibacterium halodurans]|uniref:BH3967 protein n=3 Tax=Halalkalibacterium halodurans TaxID=86665 RepID=Q9K5X0_HALH5|nr:VanZ family protein [Halalkalibacterium halodurans]MED4082600.1 VanZ family protein [Halalkalibacterium halodurans]MED4086715.1 VanZ family protein [Halalkalibacterium halodurans]MED4105601.1 VanZ family protein [Halalkalibacterium halodurans]MED4110594.1 VanZ family protein [Halalkalibacterium halodurans]MED4148139.1 VanZ family protein [Halalkalibacterium halodurans]